MLEKGQADKCLGHSERLAKQFNIVVRSAVDLLCNLHLESYLKSHEQSHPQTNLLVLCETPFEYKNKSPVCDCTSKPIICYIIKITFELFLAPELDLKFFFFYFYCHNPHTTCVTAY